MYIQANSFLLVIFTVYYWLTEYKNYFQQEIQHYEVLFNPYAMYS